MKKTLLLGVSLLCSIFIMATEIPFQKAEIKSIMRKVADWQIARNGREELYQGHPQGLVQDYEQDGHFDYPFLPGRKDF